MKFLGFMLLRSEPHHFLNFKEVMEMIKKYDFYCSKSYYSSPVDAYIDKYCNTKGKAYFLTYNLHKNNKVIYDWKTRLCWQRGGSPRPMTFDLAKRYVKNMNTRKFGGFNNWRLPTLEEGMSLIKPQTTLYKNHIDPWFEEKHWVMWTTDKNTMYIDSFASKKRGNRTHWTVNFLHGYCELDDETHANGVRLVRSGSIQADQFRGVLLPPPKKAKKGKSKSKNAVIDKDCPFCGGTGRQMCPSCGGSGNKTISAYSMYGSTEMTSPDPVCGGTGFIKCLSCQGTGKK